VIHLLRNSFKYASRADWDPIATQLRAVHTAATVDAAEERFFPVLRGVGQETPRDHQAVGERVEGVHAVPRLGRRDP
jgi:transposase-like protein